jgi:hypothetical protein
VSVFRVKTNVAHLREYPEPDASGLISLPHGQVVTRVDDVWWNGGWMHVLASVIRRPTYHGYVWYEQLEQLEVPGASDNAQQGPSADGPTQGPAQGPAQGPSRGPATPNLPVDPFDRDPDSPALPVVCITPDDYFHVNQGRLAQHGAEIDDAKRANAARTLERVNRLIARAAADGVVFERKAQTGSAISSGWRPASVNERTRGASKTSHHIQCRACDIYDPKGAVDRWCLQNKPVLKELGLWLEDPYYTRGWCHVQIEPPGSGVLVFAPGQGPPEDGKDDPVFKAWRNDPALAQ